MVAPPSFALQLFPTYSRPLVSNVPTGVSPIDVYGVPEWRQWMAMEKNPDYYIDVRAHS